MKKKSGPVRPLSPAALRAAAQTFGRMGGSANTAAQQRARRANAQHAGRPRRVCVHCGAPVKGGHVDRARDTTCGAHGWRWETPSERRKGAR